MIKKILIISLLTVSILFSSFYIKQKKAEAIAPIVAYVAVSLLVHFAVGAYIYLNSGGDTEPKQITAIDQATGQLTIDVVSTPNNEGIKTGNGRTAYPMAVYQTVADPGYNGWSSSGNSDLDVELAQNCFNHANDINHCVYEPYGIGTWRTFRYDQNTIGPNFTNGDPVNETMTYTPNVGLGGAYQGTINDVQMGLYDFIEDVPLLPTCFDGIQNQDETGIDCGGVCEINFGFVCPPVETCSDGIQNQDETGIDCGGVCDPCPVPETCNDGIMNQDETGIDYGGVCGTGDPVATPAQNFTDNNQDNIDDLSGLDNTGSIPVSTPTGADENTYDSSLPGDVSEVGETDWSGLITGYLATNPLVLLATGSSINLSGEECTLTANVFGTDIVIDFCSVEGLVDLIGTFVLGLMTIRSVFIAMGI